MKPTLPFLVFAFAVTLTQSVFLGAQDLRPNTWTDPCGNRWSLLTPPTTAADADALCDDLGWNMPMAHELQAAVAEGLLDPSQNPEFGSEISLVDWIWVSGSTTLSEAQSSPITRLIASKLGEVKAVSASEIHWAICVKRTSGSSR